MLIKACAGIVLLEAGEGGFVVSAQRGNGIALQHKDGKWSNPVAVIMLSIGEGAVFGYANKCIIVLLNHLAMDRLLQGDGSISIGVDAGFAVGKTGRAASTDIELSNKGGLGTSLVYTYSQGLLFSVQGVIGARLNPPTAPNKSFYGTDVYADILNGKAPVPDGSQVPALLEALNTFENGPDDEENKEA
jgi:lipid-binding SYLF domain-containing protein